MSKLYYVYIVTNWSNRVLYIGVTNDLERRVSEHKSLKIKGFTQRYKCTKLVYFEYFNDIRFAIEREKVLKGWVRNKKINLITKFNPEWKDLGIEWKDGYIVNF